MPRRLGRAASIALPGLTIALVAFLLLRPDASPVTPADRFERPPPDLFERPPLGAEITFATPAQAQRRRERLRRLALGSARLPERLPVVERGVADNEFRAGLPNVDRIDRLTISMPLGFTSVAYHVLPRRGNRRLLVYHNGHKEDFLDGKPAVAHFLARGYALLVLAMPLEGLNTNPAVVDTRCGRVSLTPTGHAAYDPRAGNITDHDLLACLPRPLRYFMDPVAIALNHAAAFGYERTAMVGFSGGGWTTVLYAALDPRVQRSYSVAGSRPLHVIAQTCPGDTAATVPSCFGDFEQRMPDLYRVANYLELYTLGAWGRGRKQMAIDNVRDPVSFAGLSFETWRPVVRAALRRLGTGAYDALGDTTHHEHAISAFALRAIESDLERD